MSNAARKGRKLAQFSAGPRNDLPDRAFGLCRICSGIKHEGSYFGPGSLPVSWGRFVWPAKAGGATWEEAPAMDIQTKREFWIMAASMVAMAAACAIAFAAIETLLR